MVSKTRLPTLELLMEPLGQCLTNESARRLLAIKADARLQAIVDRLGRKCNEGTLTPKERAQYDAYVSYGTFVAMLKSKARQMLTTSSRVG